MVRFTQIFRTEKKEAVQREAQKKANDEIKNFDFSEDEKADEDDEALRRLLGVDMEEEEEESSENIQAFKILFEEMNFSDEDYDYEEIEAAVDPYSVENIFAFKWCTVLEKAGGGVVQVKESFEEVFEKLVHYKKNN